MGDLNTISVLGSTLANAMWDLISFGFVMGIIFFAFTTVIYLQYHDLAEYSTMGTAMGSQVIPPLPVDSQAPKTEG